MRKTKKQDDRIKRFSLRLDQEVLKRLYEVKDCEAKLHGHHVSINDIVVQACKLLICTYNKKGIKGE